MSHTPLTRRLTVATTCAAAALAASLIGVGTAAAQSGVTVTVHNAGKVPISINIKDLKDYREDLNGGETKSIPAANLAGIDPNNKNIQWEARVRDLQNVNQPRPNTVCARGVVIFQGQAGRVDVTKCDQTAAAAVPAPISVTLQRSLHIGRRALEWKFRCVDADHDKTLVLVRVVQLGHVGQGVDRKSVV